jgi:putative MATE family efflux protein
MKTYSYGQIWKIAYPVILSVLMEQLVGMTDTAFLGRVGEVELGASALGNIFYVTIFMLGLGLGTGSQIMMGRRNGEGNYLQIGRVFYHSLLLLMLMALLMFLFIRFGSASLLGLIISSPDVCEAALEYLNWRVFGCFFAFVAIMFRSFYVATTQTKTLTLNSILMVSSNVLFNYLFIFGHCGFPAMGIAGAALGSVLAECVSMLFFLFHTLSKVDMPKYGLNVLPRWSGSLLGRVFSLSVWTMLQNFLSLATWFLFFLAVEHLGERELAVTNIIRNVSSFFYMTINAIAMTTSTLTSNLMGQGEADSVLPLARKSIRLSFYIILPMMLLVGLFPTYVLHIYTDSAAVVQEGMGSLYVLLSSYFFTIPTRVLLCTIMGSGNTRRALWIEILTLVVYTLYIMVAIFDYRVSLAACWLSEHAYQIPAMLLCVWYLRQNTWKKKVV